MLPLSVLIPTSTVTPSNFYFNLSPWSSEHLQHIAVVSLYSHSSPVEYVRLSLAMDGNKYCCEAGDTDSTVWSPIPILHHCLGGCSPR